MAHSHSRRRQALLAVPVGLALTASLGLLPGAAAAAAPAKQQVRTDGPLLSYVVNTGTDHAGLARAKQAVNANKGSLVAAYDRIGVLVVHSRNPAFAQSLRAVPGVQSAGATRTAPITSAATDDIGKPEKLKLSKSTALAAARAGSRGSEPLESLQWDLRAIKADQAARINPGSRKVTVGVIDTGVDDTHPDLAPNFSPSQSASCVSGKADTRPGAWRPFDPSRDYHGTHVAGTIAAARNGTGVAGVAPGVKVSAIKVSSNSAGSFFYAESVVCAFVFAAEHHIAVTNNSYYVDPWMFNCADDPDQKAIADAIGRASAYAQRKGVVNVAAAGNSNFDLAAKELPDNSSPNDTKPLPRKIDPSRCLDVPAQLPGVVTVSATGVKSLKSYYSNYGRGQIAVAAPGGDNLQIPDAPAKDGRILSTLPGGDWGWLQGTSMASPHVAGVLALLKSTHPKASPQELTWILKAQAKNPGCPVAPADATCTGTKNINSHFGYGIVDALAAVQD
ncbi:S8 family peptidase [Streptomyces orinoci]|uniref:S8 family serine peptidase n=1 Tax=Streptomyces orinoci TaxID=67339 RepID=A0ABV3JXE4_STRON|nr:S8 family serine peptidase [Streptomyces orinoci]